MVDATGGRVYEDRPVRSIDLRAEPKLIRTDRGTVSADEVVNCCSGYIDGPGGRLSRPIPRFGTYQVLTVHVGEHVSCLLDATNGHPADPLPDPSHRRSTTEVHTIGASASPYRLSPN